MSDSGEKLPPRLWIVAVQDGFRKTWERPEPGIHWHDVETQVYQREHAARAKAERYAKGGTEQHPRRLVSFAVTQTEWAQP